MDYDYLPTHCRALAKQFDACQDRHIGRRQQSMRYFAKQSQVFTPINPIIVLACHRKWCQSYFGHCEPCSGIGVRFGSLLSQIDTIFSTTLNKVSNEANHQERKGRMSRTFFDDFACSSRVQIDAPTNGLQQIESSLYMDPGSWLSEIFHYRSYSVSKRELLPYNDVLLFMQLQQKQRQRYYYTHFTPRRYGIKRDYNACYFHILYQPDDEMRRDIQYHRKNMLLPRLSSSVFHELRSTVYTTIGILYDTGDTIGLYDTHNITHQQISGWNQMYDCTITFMKQLIYQNNDYTNVRFYLATDSPTVIDHVQQQYYYRYDVNNTSKSSTSTSDIPFVPVYVVTDLVKDSYVPGNDDERLALLKLYLLSNCDAIVVNSMATDSYGDTVAPINPFAILAKKIGFLPNSNFYQCAIH
jgi:hypothetical protein